MVIISNNGISDGSVSGVQYDRLTWEFKCQSCYSQFVTEVPKGPSQERVMLCIGCGSRDIQRINISKLADTFFGG